MTLILKDNSPEIRRKIREAGISVCICAEFADSCWLDYHTNLGAPYDVHGVGYYSEDVGFKSQKDALDFFLFECKDPYFCKDVDEFIQKIKDYGQVQCK